MGCGYSNGRFPSPPRQRTLKKSRSSDRVLIILRSLKQMGEAKERVSEEVRDYTGAKLGMWLFLLSEILFGGMFILYSAYRYKNPVDFHHASQELDVILGMLNTLILLSGCSDHSLFPFLPFRRDKPNCPAGYWRPRSFWTPVPDEQRH